MHIIIGFLLGFFLQVVAQLGTNIRYSGAIRTSSTSPPFPLTSLCPWDYPPVTSSAFIVVLQWSGSWGGASAAIILFQFFGGILVMVSFAIGFLGSLILPALVMS